MIVVSIATVLNLNNIRSHPD